MGRGNSECLLNTNDSLRLDFIKESEEATRFLRSKGKNVEPFLSPTIPYFDILTFEKKEQVLERLRLFNNVCSAVLASRGDLNNPRVMLWHALQVLELTFPSDLFNYVSDEKIVEIYDRENIQIFRNLRFFDFTSYTLEDLFCRPWVDLFSRLECGQIGRITEAIEKIYKKETPSITPMTHIGRNHIIETCSPFRLNVDAVIDFVAPVFNKSHQAIGYIAIESGTLIGEVPTGKEAEALLLEYYNKHMG